MWWKEIFFSKQCLNHSVFIWTEEPWTTFFLRGKENKHFSSFRSFFLMTQNWVTFQTEGTKRVRTVTQRIVYRWNSDIWSNTWSCFLIHVYRRYMYASVQGKCFFFCIRKITCVYTSLNYTHIHIHTLLKMLACTDLFWPVNQHGYFIILINTMDCSFFVCAVGII